MGILSWIVFGAIAGFIASLFYPNRGLGCSGNVVVGIAGSFIGGIIGDYLGLGNVTGFNAKSFFLAVIGSIIFLVIINAIKKR